MKNLKKGFTVESFDITPESIKKFEMMENRRQVGEGQVRKIHGALQKGENPIGVLIVNEINNTWRLIDGNHRIDAVKRFYGYKEQNKSTKIECVVRIYKNLSKDEEREVYSNEAKRKNESHEDRLNLYKDTITFWKLTQDSVNEFPCNVSIYPQKNSLRFRTILDSLCTVKTDMKNGYAPRYLQKDDLVIFARGCKYEDLITMKRFITIFQKVFGDVGKDNVFTRRQGFLPLFDIFYKNFRTEKDEKVIERLSLTLGRSDILMYLNMQGREAQQTIRQLMVNYINKGNTYSKNRVV